MALRPEKLTSRLGRLLCPLLLALVAVMFLGCLIHLWGLWSRAAPPYDSAAPVEGFLTGYQTMDTIAALNFGIVIVMNIRALGVTEEKAVLRSTVRAGGVAAVLFLSVYSMLAHIRGAVRRCLSRDHQRGRYHDQSGGSHLRPLGQSDPGSCLCHRLLQHLRGPAQLVQHLLPHPAPQVPCVCLGGFFFALLSMVIANAGLDQILEFSVPVLNILYPPAIVLILLSFLPERLQRLRAIYPAGILFTGAASILYTVQGLGAAVPVLDGVLSAVPLAEVGLGWVLPALAGVLLGAVLSLQRESKEVR